MPIRLALDSTDGSQRIAILLAHQADASVRAAMAAARELSEAAHLNPLLLIECDGSAIEAEHTEMRILHEGEWERGRLLEALNASGAVKQIDIISACTAALDPPDHSELFAASVELRAAMWKAAPPNARVALRCMWFPDHGSGRASPPRDWLNSDADSILVVLPEDRQHESTVAMPVSSAHPELHGWHVMAELASVAGLWSTMRGTPLEFVKFVSTGIGESAVRLVRSMCRLVQVRAPALNESVAIRDSLPVPPGLTPAPDPFQMITLIEKDLYPEEFKAENLKNRPGSPGTRPDELPDLLIGPRRRGLVQLLRDRLTGSDTIWDSQVRLKALVGEMRKSHPWISTLADYHMAKATRIDPDAEKTTAIASGQPKHNIKTRGIPKRYADPGRRKRGIWHRRPGARPARPRSGLGNDTSTRLRALEELHKAKPPVSLEGVPKRSWDHLLESAMGVIDGAGRSAEIRKLGGDEKYVIVDRLALTPPDGELRWVLGRLDATDAAAAAAAGSSRYSPPVGARGDDSAEPGARTAGAAPGGAEPSADDPARKQPRDRRVLSTYHETLSSFETPTEYTDEQDLARTSAYLDRDGGIAEPGAAYPEGADLAGTAEPGGLQLLRTFKATRSEHGNRSTARSGAASRHESRSAAPSRRARSSTRREDSYGHDPAEGEPLGKAGSRTLTESVTAAFDAELGEAQASALRHIGKVDKHLNPLNHPTLAVSMYLKVFFAVAALLLLLLITTRISPINEALSPDNLPASARMGLFFAISTLATVPIALRRLSTASVSAQNKLSVIAAVYATALVACAVFAPQLRTLDYMRRWWAVPAVTAVVLALLVRAGLKPFGAIQRLLGLAAPLADEAAPMITAIVYSVIMAIAALNLDEARAFLDRGGGRLSAILFSFAGTAFVVTAWLIQRIRQLRRDDWRQWEQECRQAMLEAEAAAQAHGVLEKLRIHWFGTALVLTRLVNRPFGTDSASERGRTSEPASSPIRKALTASISLGEERETFFRHALPALTSPGWLTAQYRNLSDRYADSEHTRAGDHDPPRPEWCSYPVSLERARRGMARGLRWPFAYRMYDGDYDEILKDAANEASSEALLRTLHDTDVSVGTDADTKKPKTLTEVFGELLPTVSAGRMPGSVLPQKLSKPPAYEPMVWWPERIDPPTRSPRPRRRLPGARVRDESRPFTPKGFCGHVVRDDSTILQAVRVDVSEPMLASELSPHAAAAADGRIGGMGDYDREGGSGLADDSYLM